MKMWYQQSEEEVLQSLHVTKDGHTSESAAEILSSKGPNVLEGGKKKSTLEVFLSQFADLLVIILIIAAIVSMMTGNSESTIVIVAVIIGAISLFSNNGKSTKKVVKVEEEQFSTRKQKNLWTV